MNVFNTIITKGWQTGVIALLCASLVTSVACTPQQELTVVNDINNFLPAITNVGEAVCAFTPAATICVATIPEVQASAQVLITALQDYYKAEASGTVPQGIVAQLNQAISVFEANAANILDAVHVVDVKHQQEIVAIAAAAQVLLGVIESILPAQIKASNSLKFAAKQPVNFNLNAWITDYNTKVGLAQKQLPRNVSLKYVHIHSAPVRYATLGLLK